MAVNTPPGAHRRQRLSAWVVVAGFQVSAGGRIWVSAEDRDGPWRGFEDVEMATLEWVAWFIQERLLEPLGYFPPAEFEAQYYDTHHTHTSVGVLN